MRPLYEDDPRQIGGYRLVALLGEGTTAQVFLGTSDEGRSVAVKAVRDAAARDTAFRSRFAREVAAARDVESPFVVPVLDAETGGARPWIATAYAPGPALAEAVTRFGPLPAESVRTLAAGLAAGLEALHARELTHGRLSPSDVALAPDGPRIVDLGVARSSDGPSVEEAGVVVGTALPSPAFRAPEQLTGGDVGVAADVFSLGALLVHAARGTGPFDGDTASGVGDRVVRGTPDLGGLPAWLGQLAVACLAKDPADRPTPGQIRTATAGELDGPGWLPPRLAAEVAQRAATAWAQSGVLPRHFAPGGDRASVPPPRSGGRRRAAEPSEAAHASSRTGSAGGPGRRRKPAADEGGVAGGVTGGAGVQGDAGAWGAGPASGAGARGTRAHDTGVPADARGAGARDAGASANERGADGRDGSGAPGTGATANPHGADGREGAGAPGAGAGSTGARGTGIPADARGAGARGPGVPTDARGGEGTGVPGADARGMGARGAGVRGADASGAVPAEARGAEGCEGTGAPGAGARDSGAHGTHARGTGSPTDPRGAHGHGGAGAPGAGSPGAGVHGADTRRGTGVSAGAHGADGRDSAGPPGSGAPGTGGRDADVSGTGTRERAPGSAGRSGPNSPPPPPADPPRASSRGGAVEQQVVEAELVDDDEPLPPRASAAAAPGETDLPGRPAASSPGAAPPPPAAAPGPAADRPEAAPPSPPPAAAPIIRPGPERRRFLAWVAAGGVVLAGAVTGAALWGSGGSGKGARGSDPVAPPPPAAPAAPKPIRAWLRDGTVDAAQLALLSEELPAMLGKSIAYTVERRSESALSQDFVNAFNRKDAVPDVFEADLLTLAAHAAAGRLADLTSYQERFETNSWLPAVRSAVEIDGAVVGVPMTASVPVVLFHKGMYADAGVPVPRTREEWVDGLEHLRTRFGANPAFRSLYLPGRSWPVLASFMWETGGSVAVREGKAWRGGFDLPGSTDAVRFFRQLQQYAPEVADATESALQPGDLFARGQTASVIGSSALYPNATAAVPSLAPQLDAFPLPGHAPDRPGAVGLRGTALAVSATCRDIPAAVDLLTTLTSAQWRSRLARTGHVLSPYAPDEAAQGANPMLRAGATAAAAAGNAYPAAPGWSEKPLVEFGRAVLGGTDAVAAGAAANQIVAAEFGRTTG